MTDDDETPVEVPVPRRDQVYATTDGRPPAPGLEDAAAPQPIGPDGQHGAYWVLSAEEIAKGFVRPVRDSYKHVGIPGPRYPLVDMTDEQRDRYADVGYVKFEPYPPSESPTTGRYWTQAQLDAIGKGCGAVTRMGTRIAESYAARPSMYGSTFCVTCGKHLPVGKDGEFVWLDARGRTTTERVGT